MEEVTYRLSYSSRNSETRSTTMDLDVSFENPSKELLFIVPFLVLEKIIRVNLMNGEQVKKIKNYVEKFAKIELMNLHLLKN